MKTFLRFIFALLLTTFSTDSQAQITANDLINDYVNAIVKKQDATSCLSRMNLFYKQKTPKEQATFRNTVYETIVKKQEEGKNRETIALIDLYQFFAGPNDENLPLLYYIKGDISITELDDSVALKNSIKDLQMCNVKRYPNVEEYIQTLQGRLDDYRNYKPVMNRLEGVWIPINTIYKYNDGNVSPMSTSTLYHGYFQPCYIIQKENNSMSLRMLGAYGDCLESGGGKYDENRRLSQHIVEVRRNKIYVDWSSETLNEPNQEMLSEMLDFSGSLGDLLATEAFGDISNTLTDMGSCIFSSTLSSLVRSAFTPSKVIIIVQCELELVNNYEMIGAFDSQIIKIKGDGSPDIYKTSDIVLFTKWEKHQENYIIRTVPQIAYSYYPDEYNNYKNEKSIKKLDSYKHYHKLIKSVRHVSYNGIEYSKPWVTFNNIQALKQLYRNEQKMRAEGLTMSQTYNSNRNHTTLGCSYDYVSLHPEVNASKGIYVEAVEDYSTAYLHGIKQGDVLLTIDGFEMNMPKQAEEYILSQEPFTTVNLEVLRNGKTLKIPVELSYKIETK